MKFTKSHRDVYETTENGKRVPKLKGCWQNQFCQYPKPDYNIECKSNSKEDILQYIVDTHLVEWYATKLLKLPETNEEAKEYIQELYLYICEIPEDKWRDLYKQGLAAITAFVSGLIIRNCISSTSPTYKKIRGHYKHYIPMNESEWAVFFDTDKLPSWITQDKENNNYEIENTNDQ